MVLSSDPRTSASWRITYLCHSFSKLLTVSKLVYYNLAGDNYELLCLFKVSFRLNSLDHVPILCSYGQRQCVRKCNVIVLLKTFQKWRMRKLPFRGHSGGTAAWQPLWTMTLLVWVFPSKWVSTLSISWWKLTLELGVSFTEQEDNCSLGFMSPV